MLAAGVLSMQEKAIPFSFRVNGTSFIFLIFVFGLSMCIAVRIVLNWPWMKDRMVLNWPWMKDTVGRIFKPPSHNLDLENQQGQNDII